MARTAKPVEEKYVARQIKFPPSLWQEVETRVPSRERSEFIRQAVEDALLRKAAQAALHYYSTDPEALEWADFAGDTLDDQG